MNDQPNRTDGEENGDFPAASQPEAGALRPIPRDALARRAASANESSASAEREPPTSGGGLASFLHAYRRRWFLATSLGLICGIAAAAAAWFTAVPTYTSTSLIRIAAEKKEIVPDDKGLSSFTLYKGNQMQLLTSEFVLIAALRNPDIANLDVLKQDPDPVRWLSRTLEVQAPENTEFVRLSLTTPDSNGGAAIVRAVVSAYMSEVVEKEQSERSKRYDAVQAVYGVQAGLVRNKWTALKDLVDHLGSGDKGALSLKELDALRQYGEARVEDSRLRGELKQVQYAISDNEAMLAAVKAGRLKPVTPTDVENAANSDTESVRLQQALAALDNEFSQDKSTVKEKGSLAKTLADRYGKVRKSLEDQLAARRKRLAEHLKNVNSGDIESLEAKAEQLKSQAARLTQEEKQAATDVEAQKNLTDSIGSSSIVVEMTRAELDELEKTFHAVADEREHLRIEADSQADARISVVQLASPPLAPNKSSRLQSSISAGLFGFMAPVGLLLWWDVRGRRINSLHDIPRGMGLRVIGTVPHMTQSALSRTKLPSQRQRKMQICLDHSIDGIAAKLCLRRDSRNARVVLVSSATHGEGKSTLSLQLAKRLARTGASTLLVDFDLRKPTMHHVFDVPRGPGLSEFLRGESELGPIVRTTDFDNLSLLPAGSPFSDSLGTLSNGVTRSLFKQARDQFEFVVVDGSPILPVVDSLLASQHVDSVVLSIRRDVSTTDRVQSACDQLVQFGVDEVQAVLTGSKEELYAYYDADHEPTALVADDKPKPR